MTRGRLEARITVPSGGWQASLTVTTIGGPTAFTAAAAGSYFPSDLLTTLQTNLDAVFGGDGAFTVSASWGENGTGLVTIAHATQTFSLTWTSTNLRDVLGFTGNLTPAALSFTGTEQCEGVWLPNCEIASSYGNGDEGHNESDMGATVAPGGDIKALVYNRSTVLPSVRWSHVPKAFARTAAETTANASFQRFWLNTQLGNLSYFEAASQLRLYWDAGSGTYKTYRCVRPQGTETPRSVPEWDGLFDIELTRLMRVPGT